MNKNIIFYQLFENETSTYTYLLGDLVTKEAAIIDPVWEMVERDYQLISELGLNLKYILETHVHADHITGAGELRKKTGAQIGISAASPTNCQDIALTDGQELKLGEKIIKVLSTPGHTDGCLSYHTEGMVFTGDALLIRGTGRTDFQGGSAENLFLSIRDKIFNLSDETEVYPGHDYHGHLKSSVGLEKKLNPRLNVTISKEQFLKTMRELKLAYPKKIQESIPANMNCGLGLSLPISG